MFAKLSFTHDSLRFADDVRAQLIAADAARELPPIFFHRSPEGQNLQGVAGIRYAPGAIIAVGREATAALHTFSHTILDLLAQKTGEMPQWDVSMGECSVAATDSLASYSVTGMVVESRNGKRANLYKRRSTITADEWSELVGDSIRSSLHRQATQLLGVELPDDTVIGDVAVTRSRAPARVRTGEIRYMTADVTFRSNLVLKGYWHVGPLAHKGRGVVQLKWKP